MRRKHNWAQHLAALATKPADSDAARDPVDLAGAAELAGEMRRRRSVRSFSPEPVPRRLIELAIAAAHSAPSGAIRQPWRFVAISHPAGKAEIRGAAEAEEREVHLGGRATPEWLEALAPLGTGWEKPYLEDAPWLVATHGTCGEGVSVPLLKRL